MSTRVLLAACLAAGLVLGLTASAVRGDVPSTTHSDRVQTFPGTDHVADSAPDFPAGGTEDSRVVPDPSFGDLGVVETRFLSGVVRPEPVAVFSQDDGRSLVVGRSGDGDYFEPWEPAFLLARFDRDGGLDATFGDLGRVATAVPDGVCSLDYQMGGARGAALLPDGGVIVVGSVLRSVQTWHYRVIALARYTSKGKLDASFGRNGLVIDGPGAHPEFDASEAIAAGVQRDGHIVVLARINDMSQLVLLRYLPDGTRDRSFGEDGMQPVAGSGLSGNVDDFGSLALLPDDSILVAASAWFESSAPSSAGLFRFKPDGSRDLEFGDNGAASATRDAEPVYPVVGLAVQPGGRILVAGGAERSVVVAGFSPDGEADTEFGKDGVLRSGIDLYASDTASAMDMLRDGRLVVFGTSGGADFAKLAIARYLPDGAPDETLGSQGLLHLDLGSSGPGPFSLAVGLDGSIDVAGAWLGNGMLSVMRVTASGEPDQAFGASGVAATVLRGGYSVDRVADVVVDSKGRIITVGDSMYRTESIGRYLAITRHTAAGALDESFSTDGRHLVTAPDGASDLWARADVAEVTAHDRLLVAGQIDGSVGVIRLESDGTRDLSYGVDGIARISEDAEWVSALSTEPDGSALVAGDGFVARLSSDGAQVAVLADFHGLSALGMAQPGAIAVGPDGHLVVCGVSERDELLAVIRLHGDGTPDEGFGHAGAVTIGAAIDGLADTSCVGAWMRPDGRVVLAGSIATIAGSYPRATDFAVLGLLQNGDPDPSFGEGGFVRTDFSPSADPGSPSRDVAYDLLVGEGGSITIGGLATDRGIAIARFDSSGAPDRSFDQDGKVLIPARANWALDQELYLALSARGPLRLAMARRSDGRLVAATTGYQFQDYSDSQGTFLLHGLMETAASLLLPTAVR